LHRFFYVFHLQASAGLAQKPYLSGVLKIILFERGILKALDELIKFDTLFVVLVKLMIKIDQVVKSIQGM